jgi:carboxylesterase type B
MRVLFTALLALTLLVSHAFAQDEGTTFRRFLYELITNSDPAQTTGMNAFHAAELEHWLDDNPKVLEKYLNGESTRYYNSQPNKELFRKWNDYRSDRRVCSKASGPS